VLFGGGGGVCVGGAGSSCREGFSGEVSVVGPVY
jgi:hypothetical protein